MSRARFKALSGIEQMVKHIIPDYVHASNCWLIGKFECDYGYHDTFTPELLAGGPSFLYDFKRKMSNSKYAIASYQTTWRKLAEYVRSSGQAA